MRYFEFLPAWRISPELCRNYAHQGNPRRKAGAMRRRRATTVLIITIHVDAPAGQALSVKEQIAQDLERFGDTKVISIKESLPQQLGMFADAHKQP